LGGGHPDTAADRAQQRLKTTSTSTPFGPQHQRQHGANPGVTKGSSPSSVFEQHGLQPQQQRGAVPGAFKGSSPPPIVERHKLQHLQQGGATSTTRRAWSGGPIITSNKRLALQALLKRKQGNLTSDQLRAAGSLAIITTPVASTASEHAIARANVPPKPFLHVGSSRPHAADGAEASHQRADAWAPAGSLRQLEPALLAVLRSEGLPLTNTPRRTDSEPPPPHTVSPPGPFTTDELIPRKAQLDVTRHAAAVHNSIDRAASGPSGLHVARRLRPEALILEEHETLNACGRGHVWHKRELEDLWDVVQHSHWPNDPPSSSLDAALLT
jgi:hypothetical protein